MLVKNRLLKFAFIALLVGVVGFAGLYAHPVAAQPAPPQPGQDGVIDPMAVIGPVDSRVRVTDTTQIPNSAVVQIQFSVPTFGNYVCSGSVIAPQYVLTAGHCVYDDGIYSTNFVVTPGKNATLQPYGSIGATLDYVPPIWITTAANGFQNANLDYDWALLRLNSPVSGAIQPFALTAYSNTQMLGIANYINAGYPGDKCRYLNGTINYCPSPLNSFSWADVVDLGDTQWTASGPIVSGWLTTYRIGNQIDTYGGQSGSPLYVVDNAQPAAMRNIVSGVLSYSLTSDGVCYATPGALCPPASSGNYFRRVTVDMLEALATTGVPFNNPVCFQVNLSISGNGTATKSPDRSPECSIGTYKNGQVITLSAVATPGNIFSSWTGATGDVNTTATVNGTATITAVFNTQPTPPANTVLQPGIYDERNPNIIYQGGWIQYNGAGPANNTFTYTNVQNAITQFAFNGSGLTLFRTLASNRGPMEVCIDTACQTINNSSTTTQWNMPFTVDLGSVATRVIRIRNLSNSPTIYIDLDQVQVTAPAAPLGIGNYEETNANLTYTGSWLDYSGAGPKGGSFKYSNDPNARVSFSVVNTAERVIIYRTLYTGYGPVGVYVDGSFIGNMPTSTTLTWAAPYVIALTPNGNPRSIELRNTSSQYIGFEAFDVALAPTPFAIGSYEETNANLTYTGSWLDYSGAGPKGGSFRYSNDPNARVNFSVVNTAERVIIYRTLYTGYGAVGVYVDGSFIGNMPTSTTLTWAAPYVIALTPNGNPRSIELRNTSSQYVGFEAFDVTLAPPPPTPFAVGSYEETNANLTYTGSWLDYSGAGPKGGSFRYSNDSNARVSFSVVNTAERVIIYRTLYTGYGPVGVYVDGSFIGNMPTSTTLTWAAPYVIALTPNGNPRSIELRNTSSQYVGFEAFDVALAPAPLGAGLYQETNAALAYSGTWSSYSGVGPNGGSLLYTNTLAAQVSFRITGDAFRLYRTKAYNRGPMEVCIDTILPCTTVSNYDPGVLWNVPVQFGSLGAGTHNIVIRSTSASTSLYIDIDAIEVFATTPVNFVLPSVTPTSIPTQVEVTATLIPTDVQPTATVPDVSPTPTLESSPEPSPTPLPTETLVPSPVPTEVPATPEPSPTPLPTELPTETPVSG